MRKDETEAASRSLRLKMIASVTVGSMLTLATLWYAWTDANSVPNVTGSIVNYVDAREMVASYSGAIAGAPLVLARGGEWPSRKYPGLGISVEKRASAPGRLSYDIVATVGDQRICEGAIAGGRADTSILRIGDVILPPPAVQPYRNGKATIDPSVSICQDKRYPLVLRFSHEVALSETVSVEGR